MNAVESFGKGNYQFLRGGFQYSSAVMAEPGFCIERVQLAAPVPLALGFATIWQHLQTVGRPANSLCACELRSPAPMAEPEFIAFNRIYVQALAAKGLFWDDINPVARCNLIPTGRKPDQPSLYAFSYTVPLAMPLAPSASADFHTSGAAECPDRPGYRDNIVRLGDTSAEGLADKIAYALGDVDARFQALGVAWSAVSRFNLYTAHNLHPVIHTALEARGAHGLAVTWHAVRPPIVDIEIEIDASRISHQRFI